MGILLSRICKTKNQITVTEKCEVKKEERTSTDQIERKEKIRSENVEKNNE